MRQSWDDYFISLARTVAGRATCPRLSVGAVVVDRQHHILSTGYNGAPRMHPHCTDVGCDMVGGSCKRTVHAEDNAIHRVDGSERRGTTVYLTHPPCMSCAVLLAKNGVSEVVYGDDYRGYGEQTAWFYSRHRIKYRQHAVATEV